MTEVQTNQKQLNFFEKIIWGFVWTKHCLKIWKLLMTTNQVFTNYFIFDCLSVMYWMELE